VDRIRRLAKFRREPPPFWSAASRLTARLRELEMVPVVCFDRIAPLTISCTYSAYNQASAVHVVCGSYILASLHIALKSDASLEYQVWGESGFVWKGKDEEGALSALVGIVEDRVHFKA
jgi:hypothetical protein